MNPELAQDKMKSALKVLLKRREHTYQHVAELWECSLPTVKRLLGKEELPVSRLLTLLDWLDVSLGELEKMIKVNAHEKPRFTPRQNEFLAKNLREFAFLVKLYDQMTPQQIARKHKLSDAVLERILIQLEKYDLIRVGSGGKVKPTYERMPAIDGLLASTTTARQVDRMAQYTKARIEENIAQKQRGMRVPPGEYTWAVHDVSEKTYREFLDRVRRELSNLSAQAKFDGNSTPPAELKKTVISFSAQLEEPTSPYLQILSEIFDENLKEEEAAN